jgi:hypothetical protein
MAATDVPGGPSGGGNWWDDFLPGGQYFDEAIGTGASIGGAIISSGASVEAAKISADSIDKQGERQDKLSRDLAATDIEYANEQRDITLGASDYTRVGSASAYAGMLDMMGLDRSTMDFGTSGSGGTGESGYTGGGESSYTSGYNYDLNRINKPNETVANAPRYDFQADPGYQFRLDEGNRGLERSFNARGGTKSGAYDRALIDYNSGVASDEYGKIFDRLARTAGFGTGASGGTPGAGTAAGMAGIESANSISASGAARSQGQVASGNAWANAGNDIAGIWGNA